MGALTDRYEVLGLLASGGMASVLYGRLRGPVGFQREVAIKRLHPHIAREPSFRQMFIDEAHICSRLSHANIVSAFDVIETPTELYLVMEYVPGAALDVLFHASRARGLDVPPRVASAVITHLLHGLHAAHEACDDRGAPLGVVHRDVSPSNTLVGADGVARVLDFGIARARSRLRTTPGGELKGKLSYMAPELLRGEEFDRRLDIYAAAVMLWEALSGRTLFEGQPNGAIMHQILTGEVPPPSRNRRDVSPELDAVVMRGLERSPAKRFSTAAELANALETACGVASQHEVSVWVHGLVGDLLKQREGELRRLQSEQERGPSALTAERSQLGGGEPVTASRDAASPVSPAPPPMAADALELANTPIDTPPALQSSAVDERDRDTSPAPRPRRPARLALAAAALFGLVAIGYARWQGTRQQASTAPAPAVTQRTEAVRPALGRRERPTPVFQRSAKAEQSVPRPSGGPVAKRQTQKPLGRLNRQSEDLSAERAVPASRPTAPEQPRPAKSDPCTNAVQIERVNGVVVRTYKPECLQ